MASSERPELMEEVRLSKNPREREKYDNLVSTIYVQKFEIFLEKYETSHTTKFS